MYEILIDVYKDNRWAVETFREGYKSAIEAAEALQYLAHHDGDLGKRLSIRQQLAA